MAHQEHETRAHVVAVDNICGYAPKIFEWATKTLPKRDRFIIVHGNKTVSIRDNKSEEREENQKKQNEDMSHFYEGLCKKEGVRKILLPYHYLCTSLTANFSVNVRSR